MATLLGEIRPDPREPLVGEISARIAAGEVGAARDLAQAGVRDFPDGVQTADLLVAALDHLGEVERALDGCVQNAARRLLRLRAGAGPPRRLDPEQRIFVAGFFKSGSSAVLDHLRGFEGLTKWTPRGEMRLVKSPGGMADLAKRCQAQGGLSPADLVDFYLHITGWKITLTPPGRYHLREVVNRASAALFGSRVAAGYLRCCLECFLELVALTRGSQPSAEDLERHFRGWVERALDAAATDTGADLVLVDQAVNAWRLGISRFLPASRFVIVHRDPRDHFADARLVRRQPGRKALTVESFARAYRARRELVGRQIPEIRHRYGHRVLEVGFENFVLEHEVVTRRLGSFLGLDGRRYRNGWYEPARGLDGIGRHARMITPDEAAALVDALPDYLDKRAGTW